MRICDWSSDVCSSDLARHALDTRGDHGVLRAREHRLRGELDRLLRRAALAIDRHRGDAFGQARGEHRAAPDLKALLAARSEGHTSELQSLMRISYAVFCLKQKTTLQILYLSTSR